MQFKFVYFYVGNHKKSLQRTMLDHFSFLLFFKQHIEKIKMKINTSNYLQNKLAAPNWKTQAHVLRSTALALCCSVSRHAQAACKRNAHAKLLYPVVYKSCIISASCLQFTPLYKIYLLDGIDLLAVRRIMRR